MYEGILHSFMKAVKHQAYIKEQKPANDQIHAGTPVQEDLTS